MKRNRLAKALILYPLTILPLIVGCAPSDKEINNANLLTDLHRMREQVIRSPWDLPHRDEKLSLIEKRRGEINLERQKKREIHRNETLEERILRESREIIARERRERRATRRKQGYEFDRDEEVRWEEERRYRIRREIEREWEREEWERREEAKRKAEESIHNQHGDMDFAQAASELAKAIAQVRVAELTRKRR